MYGCILRCDGNIRFEREVLGNVDDDFVFRESGAAPCQRGEDRLFQPFPFLRVPIYPLMVAVVGKERNCRKGDQQVVVPDTCEQQACLGIPEAGEQDGKGLVVEVVEVRLHEQAIPHGQEDSLFYHCCGATGRRMPVHIPVHGIFGEQQVFYRPDRDQWDGQHVLSGHEQVPDDVRGILHAIRYPTEQRVPAQIIEFVRVQGSGKDCPKETDFPVVAGKRLVDDLADRIHRCSQLLFYDGAQPGMFGYHFRSKRFVFPRDYILEGMGVGEMAKIVQHGGSKDRLDSCLGEECLAVGFRQIGQQREHDQPCRMEYPEAMVEPGVDCTGVQQMGRAQLFYPTELLHRLAGEQILEAGGQGNIPPQRIADALGKISGQTDNLAFR